MVDRPCVTAEYVLTNIVPQVPEQLRAPLKKAVEGGQFKSMMNKTMPAQPSRTPGAAMIGDAFNMRHPLTGGGMTVAFSDVVTMKSMLSPLPTFEDTAAVGERVDAFYAHRTRPALTINTLANALYKVFCASGDSSMEEMRRACFEYLRLGGSMSAGPIALLGGLETNPLTLVSHFFSVALFGEEKFRPSHFVFFVCVIRLFARSDVLEASLKVQYMWFSRADSKW